MRTFIWGIGKFAFWEVDDALLRLTHHPSDLGLVLGVGYADRAG